MKLQFKTILLSLFICIASWAQAQKADWEPVDYVKAVADKTLRTVPFQFRAILSKPDAYFRGIKTINFERSFRSQEAGVAYAYSIISSERKATIPVEVSHNDGLKIWVNGKMVYEKYGDRLPKVVEEERDTFLEFSFDLPVEAGNNTILVKSETKGDVWKVYLRPRFPKVPEGQQQDDQWMKLSIGNIPHVTEEVANLSNWFVIGPFPNVVANEQRSGLSTVFPPENEFILGRLYVYEDRRVAWEIPKVEIFADVIDMHPLWGTLYDWNYHTAGYAWAIYHLGQLTGEAKYKDYLHRYCDFMLDIRPYVGYEKYELNRPYSRHIHLHDTPLLDFTTAPTLPFAYRLLVEPSFERRAEYDSLVEEMQEYVTKEQLRLDDGTFTRETPEKYTTWVDDMFMSIPFLLHSAKLTNDPATQKKYLDDAANQVFGFHKRLYDPEKNLYHHAHYSERPDVKLPYWSRANGWAVWATSEVLLHLPKSHPQYKNILKVFQNHVKGLVAMQNAETGFFHNVLNKKDSFKETSGTAIFTMAIARGINQGWLKRKEYLPFAQKGWKALETVIAEDGTVTDICMGTMCTEDEAYYYKRPVVEDDSHGLLGLMFAGIEMQKLISKEK